jgi:hypothetical protein
MKAFLLIVFGMLFASFASIPQAQPTRNLALGANTSASDDGWGGGTSKLDLVDGKASYYDTWMHGLAGPWGWGGQYFHVVLDFASATTFNKVVAWWHRDVGGNAVPNNVNVQIWNAVTSGWDTVFSTTNAVARLGPYDDPTTWTSRPTAFSFTTVTSSKLRLVYDNWEIWNRSREHGWLHEVAVYNDSLCQIPGVPLLKQNAAWGNEPYDNRCTIDAVCRGSSTKDDCSTNPLKTVCKIGQLGCFLTSAAMILNHHGVSVTPSELNTAFSQRLSGPLGCASCYVGYSHGDLKPGAVKAYAASRGITINELGRRGRDKVAELGQKICDYGPQIIGINNDGHWMVATGAEDATAGNFLVNDPAAVNRKVMPANGITAFYLYSGPKSPSVNPAAIVIRVYSPVELLVTDPLGRRVGRDPIINRSYNEIPGAFYGLKGIDDDDGDPDTEPAKEIDIRNPESGKYQITAIGTDNGTYDIDVYLFDATGSRQEFNREKVSIAKNSAQEYTVAYSQAFSPPGDLDGDGDVDLDDYSVFRSTLGKCAGTTGYLLKADYDADGCVSYADYRIWLGHYRKK